MTVASIALVPVWGIVGAAVAAAIANAGTNAWNLLEVRRTLGLSPFSRSYLRLLGPAVVTTLVTLGLRKEAAVFRHGWLAIGISLLASYLVFAIVVAALGLDADDRLVAGALWSRVRRFVPAMEGLEP